MVAPQFIGTAAGAAAGTATVGITGGLTGWVPAFRIPAAGAATPPNFPSTISLYQQAYKNWAGDIAVDAAWTCAPEDPGRRSCRGQLGQRQRCTRCGRAA